MPRYDDIHTAAGIWQKTDAWTVSAAKAGHKLSGKQAAEDAQKSLKDLDGGEGTVSFVDALAYKF